MREMVRRVLLLCKMLIRLKTLLVAVSAQLNLAGQCAGRSLGPLLETRAFRMTRRCALNLN
jgi:hypothetical protein